MQVKQFIKIFKIIEKQVINWQIPLETELKKQKPNAFQILIAILLSSRTKDIITAKIITRLFKTIKKPDNIKKLSSKKIEELIYPVGFYKTKALHLKKLSKILIDQFNSQVPNDLNNLLKLPGVGRKTANLVLAKAFGKKTICVDVHVHRISNRLAFIESQTPVETESQLKILTPKQYWPKINQILVKFGQNICSKNNPKCSICKVNKYCLYYADVINK